MTLRPSDARTSNGGNGKNGHTHSHPSHELIQHPNLVVLDNQTIIADAVRQILIGVGEDPDREGLQNTPQRVARMYGELLDGYDKDMETVVNGALFDAEYGEGEMVVVANIEYNSLCEHHLLPFIGKAHVAYVPRDRIIGLSKIPRLVDLFAHRLQVQERLTNQIADAIQDALDPVGVIVVLEGQHMCGSLRGVKKHDVNMVTTARRGEFRTNRDLRDDFYKLIGK